MTLIASFFAGAFLCNCIPHLAAGLMGLKFPTPFARPRGIGDSSALLNFFWGSFNLAAGIALLRAAPLAFALNADAIAFAIGWLLLGSYLAVHFGKRGG